MHRATANKTSRHAILWPVALIIGALLLGGCIAKTEKKADKPPAIKQEDKTEVDVLSSREYKAVVENLTAEAAAEITPENAAAIVEALEKEIDADIASEQ